MATQNLSDEDIEALKDTLRKTNRTTLIIDRISLGIAWLGLFAATVLGLIGTFTGQADLIVTAVLLAVLSLWVRSSVAQDRIKRLETALALHLLGEDTDTVEKVE